MLLCCFVECIHVFHIIRVNFRHSCDRSQTDPFVFIVERIEQVLGIWIWTIATMDGRIKENCLNEHLDDSRCLREYIAGIIHMACKLGFIRKITFDQAQLTENLNRRNGSGIEVSNEEKLIRINFYRNA